MKKTLFTAMLAATLLGGGSVFARTSVEGYDESHSELPHVVYGRYSYTGGAFNGNLKIFEASDYFAYQKLDSVVGGNSGYAQGAHVWNNTIIMTGGTVGSITGGTATAYDVAEVNGNTIIVSGGTVESILAGSVHCAGIQSNYRVSENAIVIAGGSVGNIQVCQFSLPVPDVAGNVVNLVGVGGSYSYNGEQYEGSKIQLGNICVSETAQANLHGNALNISGTDIQVGKVGADFQLLNFHLLEDQLTNTAPMVTITEADGFSITEGLKLSFDAMESMEWKPGTSVTLVEAQKGMSIAPEVLAKEYNIYQNGHPEILMATAKLELVQGQGTTQLLKLVVPSVPEPATGTLSLLALAALAARRRKK